MEHIKYKMQIKKKSGFTILELVVVMAIVAVLTSFILTLFSSSSAKSRDVRRESDLKELQRLLALYVSNSGIYPICDYKTEIDGISDCLSSKLISSGTTKIIPKDPRNGIGDGSCGDPSSFYYCYYSLDGGTYELGYLLETDSIINKSAGWQIVRP